MFLDAQTKLWDGTALTTTAVSTNAYDLGAPAVATQATRRIGTGEPLVVVIAVGSAALVVGTETYEFQLIAATASDLTTGQRVIVTTDTITTARAATELAAGALVFIPVPPGQPLTGERYLGLKAVTANSAGITVTAWITLQSMIHQYTPYPTLVRVA
jgi:Bbp16-like protein